MTAPTKISFVFAVSHSSSEAFTIWHLSCSTLTIRASVLGASHCVRFFMKLRDHRSMSYYGQRIWPPLWTRISGASAIPIIGEFGILINARMSIVDDNRCFLTMNYGATRYLACLWLDDKEFCRRLVDLLKKHHGEPIDQIAELEIPVKLLSSRSSESSLMAK